MRQTFVENLAAQIKIKNTSPAELARRTGIKPSVITRYRTDGRLPGGPELIVIAKVLDIDPELLLGSDAMDVLPPQDVRRPGRQPRDVTKATPNPFLSMDREPAEPHARRPKPTKRGHA